jgi:hypothetical protein
MNDHGANLVVGIFMKKRQGAAALQNLAGFLAGFQKNGHTDYESAPGST